MRKPWRASPRTRRRCASDRTPEASFAFCTKPTSSGIRLLDAHGEDAGTMAAANPGRPPCSRPTRRMIRHVEASSRRPISRERIFRCRTCPSASSSGAATRTAEAASRSATRSSILPPLRKPGFAGPAEKAAVAARGPFLNPLMALGNHAASALRARLCNLLDAESREREKVEPIWCR